MQARYRGTQSSLVHWPLEAEASPRELAAPAPLFRLVLTADGERLVTDSEDRVIVFEPNVAAFPPLIDDVDAFSMGPVVLTRSGDRGAAAGESASGSVIEGVSLEPPEALWRVESVPGVVLALAFSPDGRALAVARHRTIEAQARRLQSCGLARRALARCGNAAHRHRMRARAALSTP